MAISLFGRGSPVAIKGHETKKKYHFWLQAVAVLCAVGGFYVSATAKKLKVYLIRSWNPDGHGTKVNPK